jgi:hypothetical protein
VDQKAIIDDLEELAERLGVEVRYEPIHQDEDSIRTAGGLCLYHGKYVVIVNTRTPIRDRIDTLARALKHFDLDRLYIRPALREIFDRIPEQSLFTPIGSDRADKPN